MYIWGGISYWYFNLWLGNKKSDPIVQASYEVIQNYLKISWVSPTKTKKKRQSKQNYAAQFLTFQKPACQRDKKTGVSVKGT